MFKTTEDAHKTWERSSRVFRARETAKDVDGGWETLPQVCVQETAKDVTGSWETLPQVSKTAKLRQMYGDVVGVGGVPAGLAAQN